MDLDIVKRESKWPVGGCLSHFAANWEKISNDLWAQDLWEQIGVLVYPVPHNKEADQGKYTWMQRNLKYYHKRWKILLQRSPYRQQGGLYQSNIPCPKVRWLMAHSWITEQVCGHWLYLPFQNGINQDSKRVNAEGRLVSQFKGFVFHHLHTPFTPKISQVPVGGPDIGIQSPPVWTEQCSIHLLKTHEASSVHTEEAGNQIDPLLWWYADNGKKQGGSKKTPTSMELLVALGFIRLKKSTLSSTQELEFLDFLLYSHNMTIALPTHKLHALKKVVRWIADQKRTTLRELASLLGMMVAAHLAILTALLHYRCL